MIKVTNSLIILDKDSVLSTHVGALFSNIDFNGLDSAIDMIGTRSGDLTAEEKEAARDIVSEWERNVIKRLHTHSAELEKFLNNFKSADSDNIHLSDAVLLEVAAKTNTTALLDVYFNARDVLLDWKSQAPEVWGHDPDKSENQNLIDKKDYDLASTKYIIEMRRLSRTQALAAKAFRKAVNKDPDFKELVKKIEIYRGNVNKHCAICREKSAAAKLNISISSPEVRKSIRELLDFCIKL